MIGFKVNNLQLFAAHIGSLALPRAQFCWLYMVVHGCTWSAEWAWAPFLVPLDGRKNHGPMACHGRSKPRCKNHGQQFHQWHLETTFLCWDPSDPKEETKTWTNMKGRSGRRCSLRVVPLVLRLNWPKFFEGVTRLPNLPIESRGSSIAIKRFI